MSWIQTHSGRKFDLASPRAADVDIEDIAHALSNLCRYTGHTNRFYSVAEHSVLCARALPAPLRLAGQLHDATEAYVGDMASPLKALLPEYKVIEDNVWRAIAERFGLPEKLPSEVKAVDLALLRAERNALLGPTPTPWDVDFLDLVELPTFSFGRWSPEVSRAAFLSTWEELRANDLWRTEPRRVRQA
jgi:hypothetical protein